MQLCGSWLLSLPAHESCVLPPCARLLPTRLLTCSTWRKLSDAGKTTRELSDVAQLRVVLAPRTLGGDGPAPDAPVPLDYG